MFAIAYENAYRNTCRFVRHPLTIMYGTYQMHKTSGNGSRFYRQSYFKKYTLSILMTWKLQDWLAYFGLLRNINGVGRSFLSLPRIG